jgi:hypothetical protein
MHTQSRHVDLLSSCNKEMEFEKEENYMILWSYIRRRYPGMDLESKSFTDLVQLKVSLEGPRNLREWTGDIASVRKH